jgi:hypothetical protein
MTKGLAIMLGLTMFGLSACAGVPPPAPLDSQSAALGISVKLKAPIELFSRYPDRVYFVRVDKDDDVYTASQIIPSNYVKGDYVYLLNAAPGRYVAVASFLEQRSQTGRSNTFTTFFSEEVIKRTQTVVTPGTMAFMGKYVLGTSGSFDEADNAQLHYFHSLAPNAMVGTGVMASMLSVLTSGAAYYRGVLKEEHKETPAEKSFLATSAESFKGTGWGDRLQKRLDELSMHP